MKACLRHASELESVYAKSGFAYNSKPTKDATCDKHGCELPAVAEVDIA